MKFLFVAGSRSGSEFSIRLVSALFGRMPYPFGKVNSARKSAEGLVPTYHSFRDQGKIEEFVNHHNLEALKLEDPGVDDDAMRLFDIFPEAAVIATYRPLQKVINSHGNIKPWGMRPAKVEHLWTKNLEFYEHAEKAGRLVMIPLEERDIFDPVRASQCLKCEISDKWQDFWEQWPVVNDLKSQKEYSKDNSEISFFMSREEMLSKFPGVEEKERRYEALLKGAAAI